MTRAWLTAVLLYGSCGGVVLFFLLIVFLMTVTGELVWRRDDAPPLAALAAATLHISAALTYLIVRRGRIWLAPRRKQWRLALSVLLVPVTTLGAGILCAVALGL